MVSIMTVSEARAALPHLLDRVGAGEEVTITRHGQPVAVLVRPDALRVRRAGDALDQAKAVHDALDESRRIELSDPPTLNATRADELVADLRASRSRR